MTTQTAPDTDSVDLAEFRSTVRAFANAEIHPGAAARDESKEFPAQLVKRLGQQDLMGISVPEEFGGLGLSTRTQLVAIEEVARTDAALASIYTAHYLGLEPILVGGSEEQKHRWLPQLASGELLAGFALTEPDAGSDIASMRTVARRDGSEEFGLGLSTRTYNWSPIEEVARTPDAALASIYTAHYLGRPIGRRLRRAEASRRLRTAARAPARVGRTTGRLCTHRTRCRLRHRLDAYRRPTRGRRLASLRMPARTRGRRPSLPKTTYISNAKEADLVVLFAKTDPSAGFRGITAFVVPKGTPGISYSEPQDKMGIRSAPTYTVYLDDVVLPLDSVIGTEGRGGNIALTALNRARIDVAAMANGIALRAWELGREYATERKQFGTPIFDFQAIQLLLGGCDAQLVASRVTADWAADVKDAGQDIRRAASISKYVATEACFSIVDQTVQIHGGAGFMRESEIERLYRDCRILRIFEGTSQIQLLTIAGNAPSPRSTEF